MTEKTGQNRLKEDEILLLRQQVRTLTNDLAEAKKEAAKATKAAGENAAASASNELETFRAKKQMELDHLKVKTKFQEDVKDQRRKKNAEARQVKAKDVMAGGDGGFKLDFDSDDDDDSVSPSFRFDRTQFGAPHFIFASA